MSAQESHSASLVLDARNIVGESIVWDERRGSLIWIDIIGRRIHAWCTASKQHSSWQAPDIITSIGLRQDGGTVVGLRKRIALWDFGDEFIDLGDIEPDRPANRLNEGVVGPDGAFWVGTMQNNINDDDSPRDISASTGHVYRVTVDGEVIRLSDDTFGITNTMAWPEDGRFIVGDTLENTLYAYRRSSRSGRLSDRTVLHSGFERGLPDGSCLDAEGYLWNCRVAGGACLARIAPDGQLDRVVELPCSWPTSCCFGGPDLSVLYVTSARFTMSEAHLAAHPEEGALFSVHPGVSGTPPYRFGCHR